MGIFAFLARNAHFLGAGKRVLMFCFCFSSRRVWGFIRSKKSFPHPVLRRFGTRPPPPEKKKGVQKELKKTPKSRKSQNLRRAKLRSLGGFSAAIFCWLAGNSDLSTLRCRGQQKNPRGVHSWNGKRTGRIAPQPGAKSQGA